MSESDVVDLTKMLGFDEVQLAIVFILFWLWTLHPALLSAKVFFLRTAVVFVYGLLTWGDQRTFVSNAEWIAWGMVWCHWLGAFQAFIYPDPRFRRIA